MNSQGTCRRSQAYARAPWVPFGIAGVGMPGFAEDLAADGAMHNERRLAMKS